MDVNGPFVAGSKIFFFFGLFLFLTRAFLMPIVSRKLHFQYDFHRSKKNNIFGTLRSIVIHSAPPEKVLTMPSPQSKRQKQKKMLKNSTDARGFSPAGLSTLQSQKRMDGCT